MAVFPWDLEHLSLAGRYFDLAQAYLDCSIHLFESMLNNSLETTFSHAQSSDFLFMHSLELFLKGALSKSRKQPETTHDLHKLYARYKRLYPAKQFKFEAKIDEVIRKYPLRSYSEGCRYPFDKKGNLWNDTSHYEPQIMVTELRVFKDDFNRLIPFILNE